ncbi:hypothetical protein GGP78_000416 [Salinibacter ruber]|uniref:RNA-directed DNA polymerase n=1 Tax=Salinibacter ruber TaxID=146919 RepID=UPI002167A36B|nr:RNA-directed DNA polymerase [Salinibacter ruber]MCS3853766.1 hypothetical protein [Salinibacter ruber]
MDRDRHRLKKLSDEISTKRLSLAWKNTVRHGLRNQALSDLYDYMDIHRNVEDVCERIKSQIMSETFTVDSYEVVSKEKSKGICRKIVIPSAEDAIVMQCLVDRLESDILDKEPTKSAYYSRSHTPPKSFRDIDENFPYEWLKVWKKYQKELWQYGDDFEYVVMTDIAKYYDTIPLKKLKSRVTNIGEFSEEVIDMLFYILKEYVWQPEYTSYHGVGLPQLNFDAPRLLAHCFLYDIDDYIKEKKGENFSRWMDDINLGVRSISEAKNITKNIDIRLGGKGLSLNSYKTKILDFEDASRELRVDENRYINIAVNKKENNLPGKEEKWIEFLKDKFESFYNGSREGRWTQILKRFFTTFAKYDSQFLEKYVPKIVRNVPDSRSHVAKYYRKIGYSTKRYSQIVDFLKCDYCIDDVSIFEFLKLISEWDIPINSPYRSEAVEVPNDIFDKLKVRSVALVAGGIRVVGKYGTHQERWDFIQKSRFTWRSSQWASRQVAALTPRLNEKPKDSLLSQFRSEGLLEGLRVMSHIRNLRERTSVDSQLNSYLTYTSKPFPFSKVLIAVVLLSSTNLPTKQTQNLREDILEIVDDSMYQNIIRNT